MRQIVLLFSLLCLGISASADPGPADLPPDVPRVRPSWFHELYTREGFIMGQRPTMSVTHRFISGYGPQVYTGTLGFGNGQGKGDVTDKSCEKWYDDKINAELEAKDEALKNNQAFDTAPLDQLKKEKPEKCLIFHNPLQFNIVNSDLLQRFLQGAQQKGGGSSSVLYYKRPIPGAKTWESGLYLRTLISPQKDQVYHIWDTSLNYKAPRFYFQDFGESDHNPDPALCTNTGYWVAECKAIPGWVVDASVDDWVRKTFEVIIENVEGRFLRMSVSDANMFDHIVFAMMTGRQLILTYILLTPYYAKLEAAAHGYNTDYRVIGVQVTDSWGR